MREDEARRAIAAEVEKRREQLAGLMSPSRAFVSVGGYETTFLWQQSSNKKANPGFCTTDKTNSPPTDQSVGYSALSPRTNRMLGLRANGC